MVGRQLLGGGITIIGFSLFFWVNEGNITHSGLILILGAAFFWALSNIIMKNMKEVNLLHFIVWVSLVPPIPLFALSYFIESNDSFSLITSMTQNGGLSVLYVGYISTLVAFSIWGYLLKTYSSAIVTPFALLVPVVGMTVSNILLNETVNTIELFGGVVIIIGLFLSMIKAESLLIANRILQQVKLKRGNRAR